MDKIMKNFRNYYKISMADSQLHSPNDPVVSILQFCSASQLGKVQDTDVQNLLNQNPLPSLSTKDISNIISNRLQGQPFPAALKGIQLNFSFKSNCLTQIKSLRLINPIDFEAITRFVLFSYISWIYKYETVQTWPEMTSELMILFDLFTIIVKPTNLETVQIAFFTAFIIFINTNFTTDNFCSVLTYLQNFITKGGKSLIKVDGFFENILTKLTSSQKSTYSSCIPHLLKLISGTTLSVGFDYSPSSAEHIILMISRQVLAFDGISLQLFGQLAQFVNEPTKVQIIEMISNTISICINQSKFDLSVDIQESSPINTNGPFSISFSFPKESINSFSDGFDIQKENPRLEIVPSYKDLLDSELYQKVVTLCQSLNNEIDILASLFSSIGKNISKSKNIFTGIAFLTVLSYEIRQQTSTFPATFPKVMSFVQPSLVFNHGIVCDETMKMLNSLRHYLFGIMLDESEMVLCTILNDSGRFPLFLRETLLRMIDYKSKMINILSKSTQLLKPLSTAISYVQQLCFEGRNEFDSVRLVILQFVSLITSLNAIARKAIFEDMMFVTSYLSFIFDPNIDVKKFVMNQINEYLKKFSSQENPQSAIISTIYSIIAVMKTDFMQDRNAQIIIDLIELMNDVLDVHPEATSVFSMIDTALFDAFQEIKKTSKCEEFFILSIKFLIRVSPNLSIPVRNKDVFEKASFALYGSNPPKKVLESFIQLMLADGTFYFYVDNEINRKLSGCKIKNNVMIPVIFEIFEKTEFRDDIVKLMDQLLDEPNNVIACRTANFDKQLLQLYVSDYKNNEYARSLFTKIVLNLTSVSVVLSYVSYLSPLKKDNQPCLPNNMPILLDYLDELLCKTLETQSEVTRLLPMKQEKSHVIMLDNNNPSFSYCCWLSIDTMFPQYFPQLFQAFDEDKNLIEVFISMYKIKIQIDPQKISKSITLDFNLPVNQWSFLALSFYTIDENTNAIKSTNSSVTNNDNISNETFEDMSFASGGNSLNITNIDSNSSDFEDISDTESDVTTDYQADALTKSSSNIDFYEAANRSIGSIQSSDDVYVDLIIDGKIVATSKFNKKYMVKGKCKFVFCGTLMNSLPTNNYTVVGPFAIYDLLDTNKCKKLMSEEQRFFGRCLSTIQQPLYIYQPYSNGPQQRQSSFSAILIKKCKLELLSPLFKFIGYKLEDGNEYPNYLDVVFKIFEDSFRFGSMVEESYTYSGGFGMIEQVLLENDPSLLTYDLYLRFYNLLLVLQSDRLKSNLLNFIIINMNLWISSPNEDQIKIQQHWLNEIYPNYMKYICHLESFMNFFNLIILNYHEKTDGVIITNHFSNQVPKDFNNEESIKIMFQILYLFALRTFVLNDFILIASYLLKTNSILLINSITNLIKQIINEKQSAIQEIFIHKKAIALLHLIIINGCPDASKIIIEIIILIHRKVKILEEMTLYDHLNVLMHIIPKNDMNKNYLDYLLNLMKTLNVPELFPLCCWVAYNFDKKVSYSDLLNGLTPSSDFAREQFWSVWPIALASKSEATFADEMMKFIAMCSKNDWVIVFHTIEAVCNILKSPSSVLKRFFIRKTLRILNKENIDFMAYDINYIQIVYNYIFYRDMRYNSINIMFPKSPFADDFNQMQLNLNQAPVTPSARHTPRRRKTEGINRSASLSFSPLQDPISSDSLSSAFVSDNENNDSVTSSNLNGPPSLSLPKMSALASDLESVKLSDKRHSTRKTSINLSPLSQPPLLAASQMVNNVPINCSSLVIKLMFSEPEIQCGKFMFGIRSDPETGKWIDRDIFNYILHFLFKAKTQFFIQFQLLAIFFVLHGPEDKRVTDYIKTIKIPDEFKQSLQPLIDLVCFKLKQNPNNSNIEFLSYMSSSNADCILNGLSFYESGLIPMILNSEEKIVSLLTKEILKFVQRCYRFVNKFLSIPLKKCINLWENAQRASFAMVIGSTFKREKAWKNLFESFSIPNTPWESLAPSTRHYKRNQKGCFIGCPFLIVEDFKYLKSRVDFNDDENYFGIEGNKLFQMYDFSIHDERANCQIVTIERIIDAIIMINDREVRFSMVNNKTKHFNLNNISRVWRTSVLHNPTAFEISFKTGDSFIVNFMSEQICSQFYNRLLPSPKTFQLDSAVISWLNKEISNFEYLMILNYASGRSFNNASQYPIFPWILTNFDSPELDLNDKTVYRDLSMPAGALSPEKLKILVENMSRKMSESEQNVSQIEKGIESYEIFERDKDKGKGRKRRRSSNTNRSPNSSASSSYTKDNEGLNEPESKEMFLYSKAMNNALDVFTYLDRIEPFTDLHQVTKEAFKDLKKSCYSIKPTDQDIQDLDSNFTSIKESFQTLMNNTNVFHELIPEFYFFPEFLTSRDDSKSSSVELPKWASSPIDFIYKQRKALESEHVSQNLHDWIDLIWGYKQKGITKLDSFNNYDPRLYDNATTTLKPKDKPALLEIERAKILNGQIPSQLFTAPHPIRSMKDPTVSYSDVPFVLKTDVRNVVFASYYTEKEVILSSASMSPSQSTNQLSSHFHPFSCFRVSMIDESYTKTTFDVRQTFGSETENNSSTNNSLGGNLKKSVSASSLNSFGNVKKSTSACNLNGMNNSSSHNNINSNANDLPFEFEMETVDRFEFNDKVKIPIKNMRFVGFNDSIVIGGLDSYVILQNQTKHLTKQFLCIAADNKWLLAVCADYIIYLFSRTCLDTPKMLFHFYREFPCSAAVNNKFHVFIIGTKDGFLSIYQIKKKTTITTIDIDGFLPRRIVITPSWGFILTFAAKIVDNKRTYALFLHSINGSFIRSVTLSYEITAMTAMKSRSGFDYVAIANRNGAVFVFEAYSLSIEKPAMKLDSPAVSLNYNKKLKCLVAVASDGTINFQQIEKILS